MLRDVIESDLPVFFEHQRDPEAARMAAFASRAADAFYAHWRDKVLGNPSARVQTIVVDDDVAGYVASWDEGDERLVAYWLGREFWGRGIASAALAEFLEIETTRPLHAHVARGNVGSMRVLERCGFRRDGDPVAGYDRVEEYFYRLDG